MGFCIVMESNGFILFFRLGFVFVFEWVNSLCLKFYIGEVDCNVVCIRVLVVVEGSC